MRLIKRTSGRFIPRAEYTLPGRGRTIRPIPRSTLVLNDRDRKGEESRER